MKILMITENDPAGMGIAFTNAVNAHTPHHCRLITTKTRYNFNFEKDIHIPDLDKAGFDEIRDLLKNADIIHFHILADENLDLGPIKIRDFIHNKMIVHHHHGHPDFRRNPVKYRKKYRRLNRPVLVSTPDLLRLLPEARWLPNLVPVNDPLYMPVKSEANGVVRIGQAVTRKDLKNTKELQDTIHEIQNEFKDALIESDIIDNTDHKECLRRKNICNIIFDHMQGYFGVTSLESLSQGKTVIAGLDDWNIRHIKKYTGATDIPWQICRSKKQLKNTFIRFLDETDQLIETGHKSRKFMCGYWSDKKVVLSLIEFYLNL